MCARVKYGALIVEIKGKVGGTVFQGSRTGGVMKNIPPRTATALSGKLTKADAGRVATPLKNMTVNSSLWRTLSDADKLSWSAQAPNFPFLDKFGVPYTPSGYQLFMSVNSNLAICYQPALSTAPIAGDLINCGAITIDTDTPNQIFLDVDGGVPAGYFLQLSATAPISAGRQPQDNMFKLIDIVSAGFVFPDDFYGAYIRAFGLAPMGGTVFFRGKLTKADAGRNSQPYTAVCVIPW